MLANKHQAGASVCRMITAFVVCSADDIDVFHALEVTWYPYDVFLIIDIFDIKIGRWNMKIYQMPGNKMFYYFGIQQIYLRQFSYIAHADIKIRSKYSVQK